MILRRARLEVCLSVCAKKLDSNEKRRNKKLGFLQRRSSSFFGFEYFRQYSTLKSWVDAAFALGKEMNESLIYIYVCVCGYIISNASGLFNFERSYSSLRTFKKQDRKCFSDMRPRFTFISSVTQTIPAMITLRYSTLTL